MTEDSGRCSGAPAYENKGTGEKSHVLEISGPKIVVVDGH